MQAVTGMGTKSIYGLTRQSLQHWLRAHGLTRLDRALELAAPQGWEHTLDQRSAIRAGDLFQEFYKKKHLNPSDITGLSPQVVQALAGAFHFSMPLSVVDAVKSPADGSVKFALRLQSDGALIESVLIPERGRLTQCLSTQVGCAQGCRFCQTGRMGLLRQLTIDEIVAQVLVAESWRQDPASAAPAVLSGYPRITNLVFMGMGEPLDNLENLIASVRIFTDNKGLNFSPNKVTVSTVGLLPALSTLLSEVDCSLALSLHSPFEDERSRMMPVNDSHPMTAVLAALRAAATNSSKRTRETFIQYTLIRGFNDTPRHAEALASVLEGLPSKINLIPLNEHDGAAFRRPDLGAVYAFQQSLKAKGCVATIRLSKGRDIQGACGQLINDRITRSSSR